MASGFGRRFGANKLLVPVEGVPLAVRALGALPPDLFARAALVSQYEEILALGRAAGYTALYNPNAAEGISASLRLGLAQMEGMDGVLFAVCDQPWLRRDSVVRLLAAFADTPERICALSWAGMRGNPVIFPAALFPALAALEGDVGGGAVLRRHPDRLRLVEVIAPEELRDVDSRADL